MGACGDRAGPGGKRMKLLLNASVMAYTVQIMNTIQSHWNH